MTLAQRIMTKLWARRAVRVIGGLLIAFAAAPLAYLAAVLFLGAIPANPFWREAQQGVVVFVRSNGVHTWIMMPSSNEIVDWRPYAPAGHLRDPRYGTGNYVAVGYGNRDFYLNTPTWSDLSPKTAFFAFFGNGATLLHVEHDHDPQPSEDTRRIVLRPDEYRRLADFVRARFRLDSNGRTIPVLGRGYGPADMFYEANGGYSFVLTCNEWTGRALRSAGVRTGLWTPLEQSLMWRLD